MSTNHISWRVSTRQNLLEIERQCSLHSFASDLDVAFVVESNKCVVASYISAVLSFGCSLDILVQFV